jgi:hypothetical protein
VPNLNLNLQDSFSSLLCFTWITRPLDHIDDEHINRVAEMTVEKETQKMRQIDLSNFASYFLPLLLTGETNATTAARAFYL